MPEAASKVIIALDSQKLSSIMECARKHNWYHNEHLRLHNKAESLERGDLTHQLLREYYAYLITDYDKQKAYDNAIQILHERASETDLSLDDVYLVGDTFKQYHEFYRADSWIPIAVEQSFSETLFDSPELTVLYEGIIDLVINHKDLGYIPVDHKTYKSRQRYFEVTNQFVGYAWAVGCTHLYRNDIGFVKKEDKFFRDLLSFHEDVIEDWREQALHWANMYLYYTKHGVWPANFTSCDKFGGCMFQALCRATPDVRNWKKTIEYEVGEAWDPLTRK